MKNNVVVNVIHATEDFVKSPRCRDYYDGCLNHDELSKTMNPAPWIGSSIDSQGAWTILPVIEHEPLTIDTYMKIEFDSIFLRWISNIPHFLRCGLHSGIRPCCVFFFTFFYSLPDNFLRNTYDKHNRNPVVACPLCLVLRRKSQEFKPCNCLPIGHPSKV
jgi:hypothetical protein